MMINKKRLNQYQRLIDETIIINQNPITGLISRSISDSHAWIRENTYAALSIWGLSLAYRKVPDVDEDRARGYELEKCVVKLMRSLLGCLMRQSDKVERFKQSQSPADSLHAKFSTETCKSVCGDNEWGHLQIDAISIYLLTLAQMTASGIRIIWTLDEVHFIQNLVFYIELSYRIPDYGIWERGDKTNHGLPELNSSSVGLAKAALEALSELDLFGAYGSVNSMVHILADESQQCQAVLQSMLPRESYSKETDAALLAIIGYPAFAVDDEELIERTRNTILEKLEGRYGCKRFLRDGYRTAREDVNRLHYEPGELRQFENIECEWPLFFTYLVLDAHFRGDIEEAGKYLTLLEDLAIKQDDDIILIPESFSVPAHLTSAETENPGSQERIIVGTLPHLWSQSLYILAKMLHHGDLLPSEIDPLGRRMVTEPKPDLVVQVVVIAEDETIQSRLKDYQLEVQTFDEIAHESNITIFSARVLSHFYKQLGNCSSLNLTGRCNKEVGILATSKLYTVGSQTIAFTPQFLDFHAFYLSLDIAFLLDLFRTDVAYLGRSWFNPGRPLLLIPVYEWYFKEGAESLHDGTQPALISTIKKLKSGYINGTRVKLGKLVDFVTTSCITNLSFLKSADELLARSTPINLSHNRKVHRLGGSTQVHDCSQHMPSKCQLNMKRKSIALTSAVQFDLDGPMEDVPDFDFEEILSSTDDDDDDDAKPDNSDLVEIMPVKQHLLAPHSKPSLRSSTSANVMRKLMISSSQLSMTSMTETDHAFNLVDLEEKNITQVIQKLKSSEDLYEQADLVFQLYQAKGIDWSIDFGESVCTVRDLLKEVYERAGQMTQWWLVRFTAGLLHKRVEHLAKALTDILVRQKQVTIGLPPEPRETVITRPLSPSQLADLIHEACGEDFSMAMLTQEILVYLSMFARTEPMLLNQMLRLRIGLIIQVMASELGRSLRCSAEEASLHLFNLGPCDTKILLHHMLSGKEFHLKTGNTAETARYSSRPGSMHPLQQLVQTATAKERRKSTIVTDISMLQPAKSTASSITADVPEESEEGDTSRQGQWLRRRKIDGALNRVPEYFYERLWSTLEKASGISIGSQTLSTNLTKEMTQNEIKFALTVESVMNNVPVPEYRQLLVEAISVFCGLVELDKDCVVNLQDVVKIDDIVTTANRLFLEDQVKFKGDATTCCVAPSHAICQPCRGASHICMHFYDSSPSGRFGTVTYMFRAFIHIIDLPVNSDGDISMDCSIQ